ncbi:MAG: Signal transduction histidine kinase [Verrucomicrobiales bacterium]|nr:Signal transduction histidine kinase [Verrucomicrobiales bacterium]
MRSNRQIDLKPLLLPGSVLVAGVILSLSFFLSIRHWSAIEREKQAARTVHEQVEKLEQSMLRSMEVLNSIAALHHTRGQLRRDDFKAFVELALERQPELQALSWNPAVPSEQRAPFEAAARAEGFDGYCFRERGETGKLVAARERPFYVPVYFIEPLPRNGLALGFDLNSDPIRQQSMETARSTGQAVASAPVRLAQGAANESGFLVLLPVYPAGTPRGAVLANKMPAGFAVAVFRVKDLVEESLQTLSSKGIDATLYDDSTHGELLYKDPALKGVLKLPSCGVAHINVANRHWALAFNVTPRFTNVQGSSQSWLVLIGGLAFTMLTIAFLRTNERHGRAINLANASLLEEMAVRKKAEAAAAAASEAKSTFLANMSHEMRTPLNSILGHLQIMQRDVVSQHHREVLQQIRSSGNHLLGLINEVLDLAKIEAGRMEVHASDFSLGALGQTLEATFKPLCLEKNIKVRFQMEGGAPMHVRGDETKLRQVMINLLGNAVKFTQVGEIRFKFRAIGEDQWLFEVMDTGPGILPAEQPYIFQPFYQSAAAAHQDGTGLGLAIAQKQVELLGGRLELESQPGEGSRFYFMVTLHSTDVKAARLAQASEDDRVTPSVSEESSFSLSEGIVSHLMVAAELHSMTALKKAIQELRQSGPKGIQLAERISGYMRSYDMEGIQQLLSRLPEGASREALRPAHAISVH